MLANSMRYILIIVAGACDHLTKIAENEMKIIAMIMAKLNVLFSMILTFFYSKRFVKHAHVSKQLALFDGVALKK